MKQIQIYTETKKYPIYIQKGILSHLDKYLSKNDEYVLITDTGVPMIWQVKILEQLPHCFKIVMTQGEKNKSLATYTYILKKLIEHKVSRKAKLIALGGGVVGDIAGFVAATYKRGISFIQVPSTTLAMIDSSIGGKTAIDFQGYKNMIGAFYPPEKVLIDIDILHTLDKRNYHNGLVEAIKCGLILDQSLLELIENDACIEEIIFHSLKVKQSIIEQDEKESNIRMVLNFGHSFGHAIEAHAQGKLLHGEAIGIGMLWLLPDSLRLRVKKLLLKLNCPITYKASYQELLPYLKQDKKATKNYLNLVLVETVGKAQIKKVLWSDLERFMKYE